MIHHIRLPVLVLDKRLSDCVGQLMGKKKKKNEMSSKVLAWLGHAGHSAGEVHIFLFSPFSPSNYKCFINASFEGLTGNQLLGKVE